MADYFIFKPSNYAPSKAAPTKHGSANEYFTGTLDYKTIFIESRKTKLRKHYEYLCKFHTGLVNNIRNDVRDGAAIPTLRARYNVEESVLRAIKTLVTNPTKTIDDVLPYD